MSHFSVLVIGPDPEKQLQPFHEFECTGEDDEFVQDVDITQEVQASIDKMGLLEGLEYHGLEGDRVVDSEAKVNRSRGKAPPHKFGYAVVRGDRLIKAVDRTNPNRKWDWYKLGGRWNGYFKLRAGERGIVGEPGLMIGAVPPDPASDGWADACRKDQIDVEGMRAYEEDRARTLYQQVRAAVGDAPQPKSWESVLERFGKDIDGARAFYHAQEFVKRMKEDHELMWQDAEDFTCTEEAYVALARDNALVPFSILKDGKWVERGQMGWWGCVANEKDQRTWVAEANRLIDSLPGDTLLSVYDCHI